MNFIVVDNDFGDGMESFFASLGSATITVREGKAIYNNLNEAQEERFVAILKKHNYTGIRL